MREIDRDFPYRQPSAVNFFLYPPVKPATPTEKLFFAEKLALGEPMSWDRFFTIYVAIPYCRVRCHSCHFFKTLFPPDADRYALLNDYLDCLEIEIARYADTVRFSSAHCGALYLGGGTPSLLAADQVARLVRTIRESFAMIPSAEITLESNPFECSLDYLQRVQASGVTRLSLGIQSFRDVMLQAIGAPHNAQASYQAAQNARALGFHTINLDLLYRLPGQTKQDWANDLQTALSFEPQSITFYAYLIHAGSTAKKLIADGRLERPVTLKEGQEWYLWASEQLEKRGYVEKMRGYFTQPGHEKKYGVLNHRDCCEYIGLGVEAYSFINRYQFTTGVDVDLYKRQVRQGLFPVADYLSPQANDQNMMERYVIFNYFFSTLDRHEFSRRFNRDPRDVFPQVFAKLKKYGLVANDNHEIKLTALGKKWRKNIMYEFYSDDFRDPNPI